MRTSANSTLRSALRSLGETGCAFAVALVFIPLCSLGLAQTMPPHTDGANVRIGVFGLFHSSHLIVSAVDGQALAVRAGGDRFVLECSSGVHTASVRLSGREIILESGTRIVRASDLTVAGRKSDPVAFVLAVPGKIRRHYRGTLEIGASSGHLVAVVTMDRETAVASIVAAESASETPVEALKAQAVATRSYLAAGRGRHHEFDFCDTTHCQFLREPPAPGTLVAEAVKATQDMVLEFDSAPFAAMYTRSCGGRTHTLAELGLPAGNYPYYSVECNYCRSHPVHWSSRISAEDAATLGSSSESARLRAARHLGWNTVPSNDFIAQKENGQFLIEGTGQGHGIGLCQAGAKAMAFGGADFRQILGYYYPNTSIVRIDVRPSVGSPQ